MKTTDTQYASLVMPSLGETMERGTVADWLVEEGAAFKRGDAIIEFETDKTAVEYPALGDGVLIRQLVSAGDEVELGAAIALIDVGDGPDWVTVEDKDSADEKPGMDSNAIQEPESLQEPSNDEQRPIRATPVARKRAKESGIDLATVVGTGRRGRVEARDVLAFDNNLAQASAGSSQPDWQFADDIAYRAAGPVDGPRYLMVHGFAADANAWNSLTKPLVNSGSRVVSLDLPAHGATRLDVSDVNDFQTSLQNVVATEGKNNSGWHVVAHSMGAIPALAFAQQSLPTIRSLSLISPVGLGLDINERFIRGMAQPSSPGELSHLLRMLSERPSTLTSTAVQQLYDELKKGRLIPIAQSLLGQHGQAIGTHELIRRLSMQIPIRVIIGHSDRVITWQDALHIAPEVAVHHFPQAGHMPHWDYPAEVARIILSGNH